jgi:lysyl-tRNA synthetase class 2
MDLTEEIFKTTCASLNKYQFKFRGFDIDLSKPFTKISMVDFIKQETGIDFNEIKTDEQAVAIAEEKHIKLTKHQMNKGHIINLFFERFCEEKCIQPTFVHTYPVEVSPLTKKNKLNPQFTDRFELFIGQKEFANAYSELNDPIDQLERLEKQISEVASGNNEAYANEVDMDFINALEYGLPPTGGLGIGFDRFCMLFTESDSIRDVLLFPQMKDSNN